MADEQPEEPAEAAPAPAPEPEPPLPPMKVAHTYMGAGARCFPISSISLCFRSTGWTPAAAPLPPTS